MAALQSAVDAFEPWLVAVSSIYETDPWGPIAQDDFLNAVLIALDPSALPVDWLDRAHKAESAAGRLREVRWGPRTLDVDVLDVDGARSADPVLTLPHPRPAERAFVLVPWLEVDPRPDLAAHLAQLPAADRSSVRIRSDLALHWSGSVHG